MTQSILQKSHLVDYLSAGCKQPSHWLIGTEHEQFLLDKKTHERFPYEGKIGIHAVLEAMQPFGWEPILEHNKIIALKMPHRQATITLEPGGQFELSGAPLATLHDTKAELDTHQEKLESILNAMGGIRLPMGADPLSLREAIDWMPKGRYNLMHQYMPTKGKLGLDMMLRTCTVQVNLDFESETDMVAKMRIAMALQPLATALFASSPFLEGKVTGYQSYRAHIWQDTDPDRCGILPFVFQDDMGFEAYVDYLLDVPMYFVYRRAEYIDARGQSFRNFMKGELPALPGEFPTIKDWTDQTTIAFPEVRLKRFLEMRGADCGPEDMLIALPAFWVGLLYDSVAQDEALQLIRQWPVDQILKAHQAAPREGLKTLINNRTLQQVAIDVLAISTRGLQRRARLENGVDESIYLTPLHDIAQSGRSLSTKMLEMYEKSHSVESVIQDLLKI
ncbi:MAG: glutamate--cysteine ligase [Alphaproteobacteria bacterium]|jgi:glutamate--cysteine ligase|nr:glutamate--cysteine ligase [Alphaproteobacteria bacterium]